MCSLRKKIVFTFIHIPITYTVRICKSNFQMDERMDVLGLPLLVLSMARKTLQSFKNSLNGKVSIKKKKSSSSIFLIFSPKTRTCLFIPSFSLPGCWLMMVPVCSDYDPSRFPKSVWKHAVCEDSSYLVGSDEAQAAAPCVGQVKPWAEPLTPGTPELIGWALLAATQVSRSTEHLAFLSVQAASLFILKGRQPVRANLTARLVARIWKGRVFIFLCFLEILWRNAELSQCLERGNIMWWLSSCEAEAPPFETWICYLLAMWCWVSARTSVRLEFPPLNCEMVLILKETPS